MTLLKKKVKRLALVRGLPPWLLVCCVFALQKSEASALEKRSARCLYVARLVSRLSGVRQARLHLDTLAVALRAELAAIPVLFAHEPATAEELRGVTQGALRAAEAVLALPFTLADVNGFSDLETPLESAARGAYDQAAADRIVEDWLTLWEAAAQETSS